VSSKRYRREGAGVGVSSGGDGVSGDEANDSVAAEFYCVWGAGEVPDVSLTFKRN